MAITPSFDTVMERLKRQDLWQFPGGVHPPGQKSLSNTTAIARVQLPEVLYIPVRQHAGLEGSVCVEIGSQVLKGQPLTYSNAPYAVPIHAPTSGVITEIGEHTSAHPSGVPELTITMRPDGNDTWTELFPIHHYQHLDKNALIERICDAGIAGLGGAGFPTHIKTSSTKPVEFLIINGIECEPYISSDDRLMREHAWQIRQGVDVLNHLLSPKCIVIAVEDNKPEALKALNIACEDNQEIQVVSVPTVYPAGGEKQLIQVLTGREVPRKGLPNDIGCVMFNVGTCFAIADAIFSGKPLLERVVTLTGTALQKPQNVWALLGTPVSHLLSYAGYMPHNQNEQQVIMGGPMMGFSITSLDTPVVKITNCLLAPAKNELPSAADERACIRCGFCTDACPASLLPQQLYWYSKAKDHDKTQEYNLFDCIECGACAYVCPSEIPLVHYYRKAKAEIRNQRDENDKSEKAKQRFEARKARLLEEKRLREEKHRLAAEQRKQAMAKDGSAQDKIAAALARAKAKKAKTAAQTEAVEQPIDAPQKSAESSTVKDKQAKVAAAVARAKAKKAEQTTSAQSQPASEKLDKQAKVAAAVARAKAKKARKQAEAEQGVKQETDVIDPTATDETTAAPGKKAKVAAPVARAKAKKAAQKAAQSEPAEAENDAASVAEVNDKEPPKEKTAEQIKREKVAKAIAKAKAKAKQNKSGENAE
ncbi:electron transport complex subunit RsxC [Alteromonas sp. ASW11-36]|uniref:Ion-translocating oxidoreductase complex subunit C n=1 Tax=Alteromonas arenosi TaxID=3055817 RepID=A0ABT7SUZ7_9ALTE|nr:electron transport complex subunit RsxC [Alteromonas sp. ASW11-36]MDM7860019.1 electron transport complex subunit RsxC [Alteromonas sp. ASW11-36]